MKTIRALISGFQNTLASGNLEIGEAADILPQLAALMGNVNQEIINRDLAYNKTLLNYLETEEKANRAKIKAEVSPEYIASREARNLKEVTLEMIRSLKYFLTSKSEEKKTTKFQ